MLWNSLLSTPAVAAPIFWLPTPPGQTWQVIQGYGCGTHDDWDFYSLDLAAAGGPSAGAPVYAVAAGTVSAWVPASGTLILNHGGGFYTMYTHMSSAPRTQRGDLLLRGAQVGTVGDRGTPGNPHLHFTAFTSSDPFGRNERKSVPVQFAEGYKLPNIGGCNQHNGTKLVGRIQPLNERPYRAYLPRINANGGAVQASPVPGATQPPAAYPIATPRRPFDYRIPPRCLEIALGL